MANILHAYAADIVKQDKTEDGDLLVYGKATGPDLDLDQQRCDPDWLRKAMPAWFKFGNLREQHSNIAAGVGVELTPDGDDWMLKALVVDEGTKRKVEKGVLKGYSIGIKNARLRNDSEGQEWICGGDVVEVSLVDRPCNSTCVAGVVKMAGSGDYKPVRVDDDRNIGLADDPEDVHKASIPRPTETHDEQPDIDGGMAAIAQVCDLIIAEASELKKGRFEEACDISLLMNAVDALRCFVEREAQQGAGDAPMPDVVTNVGLAAEPETEKAIEPEPVEVPEDESLFKYVSADERDRMAKSGEAMPNGDFPIADKGHLKSAIGHYGNYKGDKAAAKKHIIRRAKALGLTNLLPDDWTGAKKKSNAKKAKADVAKSVTSDLDIKDIVKSAVTKAIAAHEKVVHDLRAELAEVKSRPIPGGPMLVPPQTRKSVGIKQEITEAERYEAMAGRTTDPTVARDYRAKAAQLRAAA